MGVVEGGGGGHRAVAITGTREDMVVPRRFIEPSNPYFENHTTLLCVTLTLHV